MHKRKLSVGARKVLSIAMISAMVLPSVVSASPQEYLQKESQSVINEIKNAEQSLEINPIQKGVDTTTDKEISIIVQFKQPSTIEATKLNKSSEKQAKLKINKDHEEFKTFISAQSKAKSIGKFKIDHEYTSTFNGVSMKIKGTDVEKLLESGVVKTIWNDDAVQLELPQESKEKSNQEITPFMSASKPLIGVDKLHEQGIKGQGIKVGVLDTGIDYNHPDLKDNYKGSTSAEGDYDKVKGWDFVDDDADPMETTYKDWEQSNDPEHHPSSGSSYYTSHGTHVTGTIAGTGKNTESEFATVGVAPEADVYGYRVLGPYGSGYTSDIIGAIEKSVEDGMDVINLSLGASINDPLFPTSVAANNAMLAGVVTVLANGNSGPGLGTVGSPGTSPLAISVGASTTNIKIDKFNIKSSNNIDMTGRLLARDFTTKLDSLENTEHEVVFCGYGFKWDFNPSEVKGKVALIERGELALAEKVMNAKAAGAKAVILYNNVEGEVEHYLGENTDFIPSISITKEKGEALREATVNEGGVKININLNGYLETEGDILADFSSRGPVNNGDIKPDVVAPGVSIMSTYPEFINHKEDGEDYSAAYARISGTSMAAPHVAGLAALVLEENKDYDAFDVKVAMMNTSDDLAKPYGVNEMGAGRIDAVEAVNPGISIKYTDDSETIDDNGDISVIDHETGAISFGSVAINKEDTIIKKKLEVQNNESANKKFDVSIEYVTPTATNGAKDAVKNNVKLEINAKKDTIDVKKKAELVDVKLTIPKDAEQGTYQGYIKLVNSKDKSESYQLPFSVKYIEPGMGTMEIDSNAATNDLDWVHPWLQPGVHSTLSVNTPVETIDILVRDYETNELIGTSGRLDASMLITGTEYMLNYALNPVLSVSPIDKDGNIDPTPVMLEEGKYKLEFVATDKDGNQTSKSQPLLVDNTPAKVTDLTEEGGVYELNELDEDMFTTEKDDAGVEHKAFWVKGKVSDQGLEDLKSMGIDEGYNKMSMQATVNGRPYTTFKIQDDGSYKFGITMEDLEYGAMELRTLPLDVAASLNYNQVPKYFFIEEGKPYLYTKVNKKEIVEGEDITVTLDINNIENASNFDLNVACKKGYEIEEIKLNSKVEEILKSKGYKATIKENLDNTGYYTDINLNVQITDSNNNPVNIDGDIPLVDITFKLIDDTDMDMYTDFFISRDNVIKDKDGKNVKLESKIIYDSFTIYQTSSVARFGEGAEGIIESGTYDLDKFTQYKWVEDSAGNKYEVKFDDGNMQYYVPNLPISEESVKVVSQVPGHFKTEVLAKLYRKVDGNLVGKNSFIYFNYPEFAGDVNQDGVIDILDAKAVADVYKKDGVNVEGKDFNLDGKVNERDMGLLVNNFLQVNIQDTDAPEPKETLEDGTTLDDILKAIGYNK